MALLTRSILDDKKPAGMRACVAANRLASLQQIMQLA